MFIKHMARPVFVDHFPNYNYFEMLIGKGGEKKRHKMPAVSRIVFGKKNKCVDMKGQKLFFIA